VATSLHRVMASLRRWSFDKFGGVTKELEAIRIKMEELCSQDHIANQVQVDQLRDRMDELLYREEMMWLQRSCISWLKEGDRNTKFFHRKATSRAKKNKIKLLKKDNGEVTKEKKEMESMARDFFQQLYNVDPNVQPEGLLHLIQPKITEEMNKELCKEVSNEEVGDALFQMGPLKEPGPDGFPARFFQKNWETMKKDVITRVKYFFASRKMPQGINDTTIVLIPKKDDPDCLKDYRAISLCNVIYNIVSKCMVNRLRPLLQDIIAPTQSTFIPGRMIIDNALIAFECLHALKTGNRDCKKFEAYKLDLTKAYERVDWRYLEGVLR
jgi:hypothetical protein